VGTRLDRIIDGLIREFRDKTPEHSLPDDVGPEPEYVTSWRSFLKTAVHLSEPPAPKVVEVQSLAAARDYLLEHIRTYHGTNPADPRNFPIQLLKAPAGVGKSHLMAREAERLAESTDRRVAVLGPRHTHFTTMLAMAERPEWWYEWLARSNVDPSMCLWPREIEQYMGRGFEGGAFCRQVCGYDYINGGCPWHAQKNLFLGEHRKRIMYGQHAHLFTGHPVPVGYLIGDECPLGAVVRTWVIPAAKIAPANLPLDDPLTEVLHLMVRYSQQGQTLSGHALMAALGGPAFVLEAIDLMAPPPTMRIRTADQVHDLDYNHLPMLAWMLKREAEAALKGDRYPHRVRIDGDGLTMDTRHRVTWRGLDRQTKGWPLHTVWLDATGDPHAYQGMFGRPVETVTVEVTNHAKIIQVMDRANGVGVLKKEPEVRKQLVRQAAHVAEAALADGEKVGIVALLDLVDDLKHLASLKPDGEPLIGHYYAERGSNDFQDVKVLLMAGLPMPPAEEIHRLARCLWIERMEPFTDEQGRLPFSDKNIPFNYRWPDGTGRAWPVKGLWGDPDLEALQYQLVDAEMIQSINRVRGVIREDDQPYVVILSNRPIPDLKLWMVVTIRELLDAPGNVSTWLWARFMDYARGVEESGGTMTVNSIIAALECDRRTASDYFDRFKAEALKPDPEGNPSPWEEALVTGGRGRPARALVARPSLN
jgi:hypothetical protein